MSSDVEEYQEVVDKYFNAPQLNKVAAARVLSEIQYSRELVTIQRTDRDELNRFLSGVATTALNDIKKAMSETMQLKLNSSHTELKRLKEVFKLNRQKLRGNKKDLKLRMKEIQDEEFRRGNQLESFVESIAQRELKQIVFRTWVVYRNARKFSNDIVNFCKKYRNRRLIDKTFSEWKYMITKFGIEMRLKKKYEMDLNLYKEEHLHVIALLQENIRNVEDEILRKRQARKEFSYNLSRNLLKTISNLSMEVVSLNQYAIKDKEMINELEAANITIKQKLKDLENIKISIMLEEEEEKKIETQHKSGLFSTTVVKSSFM